MSRRSFLSFLFSAFGSGILSRPILAARSIEGPACVITPAQTEGPFFMDRMTARSDLRRINGIEIPGLPLEVSLQVQQINTKGDCSAFASARVDIWHCDAAGIYSGVNDRTSDSQVLRGHQITDTTGRVTFLTIFPGWYPGRTPHIHFKVRAHSDAGTPIEFTSQLYFPDAVSKRVYSYLPYAKRTDAPILNREDWIFRSGGEHLLMTLTEIKDGFAGKFTIGVRKT